MLVSETPNGNAFPSLSGARVVLEALHEGGLQDMFEYSRDPRLYQHLEFKPHETVSDTRAYLEKLQRRTSDGTAHYWFVRLKQGRKVIGTIGVHSIDWRKRLGELGYGLAPTCWGGGYFHEALSVVLYHLFEQRGFHRVAAKSFHDNAQSIKALKRAGFVEEGVLRDYYLTAEGCRHDAALLSLLAPEYRRLRRESRT